VPATRALRPLLDWSDPGTVYLTYGKIWFPVFAAFSLCAFVVHQRRRPAGWEKWAWRVALTGYLIATLSVFGDYYTPWIDQSFVVLTVPGLLISLVGSTMLGIALLPQPLPTTGHRLAAGAVDPAVHRHRPANLVRKCRAPDRIRLWDRRPPHLPRDQPPAKPVSP
jgi:hypothetical protein